MMFASTGDDAVRAKGAAVVATLAECQNAWTDRYPENAGYLFPYDPSVFTDMLLVHANSEPVYSVPFYTLHKIMAGLLDQYTQAGNTQAFDMVIQIANWVNKVVRQTIKNGGQDLWQRVLCVEWGGMNDVMYNLYAMTDNTEYFEVRVCMHTCMCV